MSGLATKEILKFVRANSVSLKSIKKTNQLFASVYSKIIALSLKSLLTLCQ
jgi:hypothetical protein